MRVIDADAHVEECTETWEYLEPEFHARRPVQVAIETDTTFGNNNAFWLIEAKVFPKMAGRGIHTFGTPPISVFAKSKKVSIGSQTLGDVEARLADMDKLRIDTQVLFPTLFLHPVADNIQLEAALCRSYNTWLAKACARSHNRLKFAAVVPIREVSEAVRELRRVKELGAAIVTVCGLAWDKEIGSRDLFPFYEEACRLDLPVGIHFGWGAPALSNIFETLSNSVFCAGLLPVIMGFHSILTNGVLDEFPKLRLAFLESGSEWLPFTLRQLARAWHRRPGGKKSLKQYLDDGNIFISVEADEDIPYLLNFIGEDQLVIASDYPHVDASTEEHMVQALERRGDLSAGLREKILWHNPARLYGFGE
jgi:predicted TIM-barrel fold metal-dependent hydrolase